MAAPKCSLNISTYNWPEALRLCLQTVLWQEKMPDEVVIADDGSGAETKMVIDAFAALCPVPVVHVWHEDHGYQLPKIQNKAIVKCAYEYIIQIDGDCLLHPKFVADHLHFARQGCFVSGSRSMINEIGTNKLLKQEQLKLPLQIGGYLSKKYNAIYNRMLSTINYLIQRSRKNYLYVKGCNMVFWKTDLLKINGHNEAFIGWGKEDNDISLRLLNAGVGIRFVKFGAIQYHLHHKGSDASRKTISEALLEQTVLNGLTYTPNGIDKYL